MDETTDAGLDELTSDALGIDASSGTTADESSEPVAEEPQQTAPVAQESAPAQSTAPAAPTAQVAPTPQAPATIELDLGDGRGPRQFTKEQLAQTLRQFPHIQKLYTEQKAERDRLAAQQPQQGGPTPADTLRNIRSSFDPAVKQSVEQGFMEQDFAVLYPNLSASMMLIRDQLTHTGTVVRQQAEKIAWYEQQQSIQETRAAIDNNMQSLAGEGPGFADLADPQARADFFQFLVATNAPTDLVLNDRDYVITQWVGFKHRQQFMGGAQPAPAQVAAQAAAQARATAKRRAQGAPLPGSRPAAQAPAGPQTPLDEMVDEFFAPRR